MNKIVELIKKIPDIIILLLGIIWKYIVDISISSMSNTTIGGEKPAKDVPADFYYYETIALFFAPLIETLVFQLVPIEFFLFVFKDKPFKHKEICAVVLSALLFGMSHSYNLMTIIATSISGIALSASYAIFRYKRGIWYGYLMTVVLHFLVNASIRVLRYVLTLL